MLSLESAAGKFEGETDIFIYPGYSFNTVDAMITNFHLLRTTLLMPQRSGRAGQYSAIQEAQKKNRFFLTGMLCSFRDFYPYL